MGGEKHQKPFRNQLASRTIKTDKLRRVMIAAADSEGEDINPLAAALVSRAREEKRDVIDLLTEWFRGKRHL